MILISIIFTLVFTIQVADGSINILEYSERYIREKLTEEQLEMIKGLMIAFVIIGFITYTFLSLYFTYVLFSFVKHVGLGNMELVLGIPTGYVQRSNINNNYIPPQISNNAYRNQNTYIPISTQLSQPSQQNQSTGSNPLVQSVGEPLQIGSIPLIQSVGEPMQTIPLIQPVGEPNLNYPNFSIKDYRNISNFVLTDPDDIAYAQLNQNAVVNDFTLPSGLKISSAHEGKNWIVRENEIMLI
jgi:hypothetical protein